MTTKRKPLIVMSAGGTGGHMFPSLATAKKLYKKGWRFAFITDKRGKAWQKEQNEGDYYAVCSMPLSGRKNIRMVISLAAMGIGLIQAIFILLYLKPQMVVGFGGYASVPALVAARLLGIKYALHEQNAVLGRANRLFARGASALAMSFAKVEALEQSDQDKSWWVGNPVRSEIFKHAQAPYHISYDAKTPLKILITGGSQGAYLFGEIVPKALAILPSHLKSRLQIVQQIHETQRQKITDFYHTHSIQAKLDVFFDGLGDMIADCHLIIGRAGASTIAEVAMIGRPCLLIPYPHAVDDHQKANASNLADAACGWVLPEKGLNAVILSQRLKTLLSDPQLLATAAQSFKLITVTDAADNLARLLQALHHDCLFKLDLPHARAVVMRRHDQDKNFQEI
ncbi:MAG: undecaprenyldiphospho-muramoylpentapeptide beta-N-acetylglucosaminyltransferase [Pseudomonadota bacterium]